MLELINVKKIYKTKAGDTAALDGLSLTMPDSGLVFVTGRSGSGKTTLLNVVGALDGIDSGDIIIDGKKFSDFTPAEYSDYRNTCVGFVFQEYNLLPDYNVEKNIKIANELQGKETTKEEIDEILKIVDLEGLNDRMPGQLSGGQKQRVAIARALIKKPKIIMADEPTGALDQTTGYQVMDTLKKLSKTNLVMVVSHDLEMAEKYADRIIRLVDGILVEDVLLTDTSIQTNVIENEDGLTVKTGSDLNKEETASLLKAIRENKEITFTQDISVRQREKTPPIKAVHPENPEPFVSSKMKLKSSMGLGVNSLKVKPFRLIVTIILSVFAFALFGIFDTVGAYNDAKVLANLLRSGDYTNVTASAQYAVDGYSSNIRLTQEQIDDINKKTGYNFRGLYELQDNSIKGVSQTYNIGEVDSYSLSGPGSGYYHLSISDFVEFKNSEISGTRKAGSIIDKNGFNLKILAGEYPQINKNTAETKSDIAKIAISSYLAESIMFWHNSGIIFSGFNFSNAVQEFTHYSDLIGLSIKLTGETVAYEITGIIDCGEIPEKFDELKNVYPTNKTNALESDLETYIHTGLHMKVFVADGFTSTWKSITNRKPRYTTSTEHNEYKIEFANKKSLSLHNNVNEITFYKDADSLDHIVYFDANHGKTLGKDEILINIHNFDLYYQSVTDKIGKSTYYDEYIEAYSTISHSSDAVTASHRASVLKNEVIRILNEIYVVPQGENYDLTQDVTLKIKNFYTNTTTDKSVKIVGFYFNVNTDLMQKNSFTYPLMLSVSTLNDLGVSATQGDYARMISPINSGYFNTESLGNMFSSQNGLKLSWYGNTILDVIEVNRESLQQFANLFLYFSIVLALFSVFMLFNYISTSIVARRQSIGVLRALGSNSRDIFRIFITESLIIAIINGILACVVSAIGCIFVNMYIKTVMGLTISFAIYSLRQIIITILASLGTGILASLLPIIKICKEKPVDLIRKS